MLQTYLADQIPVTITLQNKIRVSGKIRAFDSYVIILEDQKREIVYRHAVSCLSMTGHDEQRRSSPVTVIRQPQAKSAMKNSKPPVHKAKPSPPPQVVLAASSNETCINSSMKEGLLKWMQEQRAAK